MGFFSPASTISANPASPSPCVQVVFQGSGERRNGERAPPADLPGERRGPAGPLSCEQRAGSGGGCSPGTGEDSVQLRVQISFHYLS